MYYRTKYYLNNDYINDGSDNCDYNDQKVSHHMILMSRYKGQLHDGKKDRKIWAMPERKRIFPGRRSLALDVMSSHIFVNSFRTLELRCQIISGITELPT